jgi:hypothetical protein
MGAIANSLRAGLRDLAQSDARFYRELEADLTPRGRRALPDATRIEDAIRLLRAHGYTVTPPQG